MGLHVVFGAGPVGSSTAALLAEAGHEVRLVSRHGPVTGDASSAADVRRLVAGADAVYNCVNPKYTRWEQDWPPIASALLAGAVDAGAVLVTMSNLYGYGPVDHPLRESDPLAATFTKGRVRAAMWEAALASGARVTEARASDFFGPGLTATSLLGDRFMPRVLAGKPVTVLGDPDAVHTWSYVPDVARVLAVLGTDSRAWGRPWHVPSAPAVSVRTVAEGVAALAGLPAPRVRAYPHALLRAIGVVWPLLRELEEVRYQHTRPFVMDSSDFTATFGLEATPFDAALRATAESWGLRRAGAPL